MAEVRYQKRDAKEMSENNLEILSKMYLELANVVPESCKSYRELRLEKELQSIRDEEYTRVKSQFSDAVQAQLTLLAWFRHMRDNSLDALRKSYGSVGVDLLEKALADVDKK